MDTKVLFERVIQQATTCFSYVTDDQLGFATPCTEWDLAALINHMIYEVSWVPDLLAGKTVAAVGDAYDGDLLGKDLHKSWEKASQRAQTAAAVAKPSDIAYLSYADVTADVYLAEVAGDILIHTWDVAQAVHCSLILEKHLVEAVYHNTLPRKDEFARSGLFATPLKVKEPATTQTKLLALVGRKEP